MIDMNNDGKVVSYSKLFIKENILWFVLLFTSILLLCVLGIISQPLSRHSYIVGFILCNIGSDLFAIFGTLVMLKLKFKISHNAFINNDIMFYTYFVSLSLVGIILTVFFKVLVASNPNTIFNVVGIISIGMMIGRLLLIALVVFIPMKKKSIINR